MTYLALFDVPFSSPRNLRRLRNFWHSHHSTIFFSLFDELFVTSHTSDNRHRQLNTKIIFPWANPENVANAELAMVV
jgi:hypothetical protein